MYFVFNNPTDMTITEISGTQHELKNVLRISMSPIGTNQFTLRVEYLAKEGPLGTTVPDCVLLALIDYGEYQHIENICNQYLDPESVHEGVQKSIEDE